MAHVWETSYPPGVSWGDPLPAPVPVESFLETAAAKWPDKVAIDFYDVTFTYRRVLELAEKAAKGFQALGVGPGVHVGLHLPNTPHYIICFFGVLMAGGRVVNFSPLAAPRELKYQITDSDVQMMVTLDLPTLYPQIAALKGAAKLGTVVVCSLEDFIPAPIVRAFVGPAAERVAGPGREIGFKELTHANFSAVVNIRNRWVGDTLRDGTEKVLIVLPLFHIFGLSAVMLVSLATGTEMVLHIRFDPERVLADFGRKKITVFGGVPTMYTALVNHPKIKEFDLSSLRLCGSGGAPLPVEVLNRFKEITGLTPQEGYGLTETAPMGTMQKLAGEPHAGTVGLPAPHTIIEVVDIETGITVLPVGERGEICFRGPQVMKGYWKKPEATEAAFLGGRFHTGDIGFIDAEGYVTLVDRKKDMILSGGYNVFPRNIEEAIYEHPAVAEVTVIGVSDPYRGQAAKAFIALKPGARQFSFGELKAFLADKLAKYEMPAEMEFRQNLPKTPVGKLSKKELVAEEIEKRAAGAAGS